MPNPPVVKARVVEVVVKDKDKAVAPAGKAKDKAEEVKKSIMGMHLTPNPRKGQGLVDLSGVLPRDANPSIKGPENREIQAKASDFTQDLA
jgi:hypothetical protein